MANYPYTILPNKEVGKVFKPLIFVRVGNKKSHKITPTPISALIDSGADVCFCADFIGMWLGIKLNKSKPFYFKAADNKKFITYREAVILHVANKSYEVLFYFSDTLPREAPIILGQIGFFDKFRVTLDLPHATIEIN